MIHKVIQDPNSILHKKTKDITNFRDAKLLQLIKNMKDTLKKEDGVGLAAPQINVSLNVFVIPEEYAQKTRKISAPFSFLKPHWPIVFINPKIIYHNKKTEEMDEGCLSVKGVYYKITRSYEVMLQARDEKGRKFKVRAEGLLARIFQHETDHLNGLLFLDRLHEK